MAAEDIYIHFFSLGVDIQYTHTMRKSKTAIAVCFLFLAKARGEMGKLLVYAVVE